MARAGADVGYSHKSHSHAAAFKRDRGRKETRAARRVVKVVADDGTVEPGHQALELVGTVRRLPIARNEDIGVEGVQRRENNFPFGPCRGAGTLKVVAAIQQKTRPIAARSLAIDCGFEARIAAHHLDFRIGVGEIFRVGLELCVRVGEVQKRDALAFPCAGRKICLGGQVGRGDGQSNGGEARGGHKVSTRPRLAHEFAPLALASQRLLAAEVETPP